MIIAEDKYSRKIYFKDFLCEEDRKIYTLYFQTNLKPKEISVELDKETKYITAKTSRIKKYWHKIRIKLEENGFQLIDPNKEEFCNFYIIIPLLSDIAELFNNMQKNSEQITLSQIEFFCGKSQIKTSASEVMKHRLKKKYSKDDRKIPKKWEVERKATPEEMAEIQKRDEERKVQEEKDKILFKEYLKSLQAIQSHEAGEINLSKEALEAAETVIRAYNPYFRPKNKSKSYAKTMKALRERGAGKIILSIPYEKELEMKNKNIFPEGAIFLERDKDTGEGIWICNQKFQFFNK